jgi:hypothetical protein
MKVVLLLWSLGAICGQQQQKPLTRTHTEGRRLMGECVNLPLCLIQQNGIRLLCKLSGGSTEKGAFLFLQPILDLFQNIRAFFVPSGDTKSSLGRRQLILGSFCEDELAKCQAFLETYECSDDVPAPMPVPMPDDPVSRPVPLAAPIPDDQVTRPAPVPKQIPDDPVTRPTLVQVLIPDDPVTRPSPVTIPIAPIPMPAPV